jgi:hypothetical protein
MSTNPAFCTLEFPHNVAVHGVPPNELTASEERDWLAGTTWHKHVRARIEPIREEAPAAGRKTQLRRRTAHRVSARRTRRGERMTALD